MITLQKVSKFKYQFISEDKKAIKSIQDFLSIRSDGYYFLSEEKKEHWDGMIRFYDSDNRFYAGMLGEVQNHLLQEGLYYSRVVDNISNPKLVEGKDFRISEILNPHQKETVSAFFKVNYGIAKVPTRGGKTFIASELIRIVRECRGSKCLFFVDGVDLFAQSVIEIAKYLKIKESDIGTINDKGFNPKDITIAMIQTVTAGYKNMQMRKLYFKYFKTVGFLLVDECHEYSSKKRLAIQRKFEHVDFLFAMSATPYKGNNHIGNIRLKGYYHDVFYEVDEKRLKKEGILAIDKIYLLIMEHRIGADKHKQIKDIKGVLKYQAYQKEVIHNNEARNKILIDVIKICRDLGYKTLVLFVSKTHGNEISNRTGHTFLSGDDKKEVRNSVRIEYLKGSGKVLLASDIYKKGITLPEVEIFINADGGLEESGVIQKKGRVLGTTTTKKKALIIDFFDIFDDYFSEHSMNRLGVYEDSVGREMMEFYDVNESEFKFKIRTDIMNWFEDKTVNQNEPKKK